MYVVVRAPLLLYAFVPTYSSTTTFEILVLLNALSSDALEKLYTRI